jgi:hypothetical protein
VEAGTIIATAKGTWEVGKAAYDGWRWYEKWKMGTVSFHTPKINKSILPGKVDFEGTHKDAWGTYWLVGFQGDLYWPKGEIYLKPDGTWSGWVSVGSHPGPREAITGLFWASDFMNDVLREIKARCDQLQKWDAVKMRPPRKHMLLVQGVVLNVQ